MGVVGSSPATRTINTTLKTWRSYETEGKERTSRRDDGTEERSLGEERKERSELR